MQGQGSSLPGPDADPDRLLIARPSEKVMPSVSVIVPTHNRADLIGEALRSVLDQTYGDFEVLVIDNGSNDHTAAVVAGLMSPDPAAAVAAGLAKVTSAARELGALPAHPFMALSFLALPVIPALRLTDRGLVDVAAQRIVSLDLP